MADLMSLYGDLAAVKAQDPILQGVTPDQIQGLLLDALMSKNAAANYRGNVRSGGVAGGLGRAADLIRAKRAEDEMLSTLKDAYGKAQGLDRYEAQLAAMQEKIKAAEEMAAKEEAAAKMGYGDAAQGIAMGLPMPKQQKPSRFDERQQAAQQYGLTGPAEQEYVLTGKLPGQGGEGKADKWTPNPDDAQQLRNEFNTAVKDFNSQTDSYGRVIASAKKPSAAGDLALIFNYMKILDPGSTVREGEFANAQNSAGIPERMRAMYNSVINGQRLSDEQRGDFVSRAGMLYGEAKGLYGQRREQYRGLAQRLGYDPEQIFIDYPTLDVMEPQSAAQQADPLEQMAQEAIAAGADPEAVRRRMEQLRASQ